MSANKMEKSQEQRNKYIVPPSLIPQVREFEDHYKAAEREPIMIIGPTGVGKSLFLHIFRKLFEEEHSDDKNSHPIVWANCSHFGGEGSDPNIARSELFGHVRGAFSGASNNKEGLVNNAKDGALILEEIGELPRQVQAMLLTFIETGEYYKVGDTKIRQIKNVQIIGATNNEDELREDFKFRFFPFYIDALCKRRGDILYYLYAKYPKLVRSLSSFETLSLLAYNWPGNVREIERVARILSRYEMGRQRIELDEQWKKAMFRVFRFHKLERLDMTLRGETSLYNELKKRNINVELIKSLLNKHGVGLSDSGQNYFFEKLPDRNIGKPNDRFDVTIYEPFKPFDSAYHGFKNYCCLFFQNYFDNKNLNIDLTECTLENSPMFITDYPKNKEREFEHLASSIFQYLSGIDIDRNIILPDNYYKLKQYFIDLSKTYPSNSFIASALNNPITDNDKGESLENIWSLSEKEVLKLYYNGLLKRTRGKTALVAKLAKEKTTTVRSRLEKLNIPFKKNQIKEEDL